MNQMSLPPLVVGAGNLNAPVVENSTGIANPVNTIGQASSTGSTANTSVFVGNSKSANSDPKTNPSPTTIDPYTNLFAAMLGQMGTLLNTNTTPTSVPTINTSAPSGEALGTSQAKDSTTTSNTDPVSPIDWFQQVGQMLAQNGIQIQNPQQLINVATPFQFKAQEQIQITLSGASAQLSDQQLQGILSQAFQKALGDLKVDFSTTDPSKAQNITGQQGQQIQNLLQNFSNDLSKELQSQGLQISQIQSGAEIDFKALSTDSSPTTIAQWNNQGQVQFGNLAVQSNSSNQTPLQTIKTLVDNNPQLQALVTLSPLQNSPTIAQSKPLISTNTNDTPFSLSGLPNQELFSQWKKQIQVLSVPTSTSGNNPILNKNNLAVQSPINNTFSINLPNQSLDSNTSSSDQAPSQQSQQQNILSLLNTNTNSTEPKSTNSPFDSLISPNNPNLSPDLLSKLPTDSGLQSGILLDALANPSMGSETTKIGDLGTSVTDPSSHFNTVDTSKLLPFQQVARQINVQMDADIKSMKLMLHPDNLGGVQVNLDVQGNKVQVHMTVDNEEARKSLENSLPQLRHSLESQNLKLDKVELSVDLEQQNSHTGSGSAPGDQRQGRGGQQRPNQNAISETPIIPEKDEKVAQNRFWGYNKVEYTA